jgi:hypothetical protein
MFIADQMIAGLESCDMHPHTDCGVCKTRCEILQPLLDQGFRSGLDNCDIKKKWNLRDESYWYQEWLAKNK